MNPFVQILKEFFNIFDSLNSENEEHKPLLNEIYQIIDPKEIIELELTISALESETVKLPMVYENKIYRILEDRIFFLKDFNKKHFNLVPVEANEFEFLNIGDEDIQF